MIARMASGSPARVGPSARCRPRQIVALGGGGFTEEPDNPALDEYVLAASGRDRPRVCFLATAGGDSPSYTVKFYNAFSGGHCEPSHLALFNRTVDDARSLLLAQDVIYVGGGNTVNLLAVWRAQGVDAILREAWHAGVVLAGLCAGSMCWFEGGVTASFGRRLAPLGDGLGFLPGSNCPHYRHRREAYADAVRGGLPPGLAADDGVALHFVDRRLAAVVASRPERRAYRVGVAGERLVEAPLRPIVIDGGGLPPPGTAGPPDAEGAPAALAAVP
jgi:peptidase E